MGKPAQLVTEIEGRTWILKSPRILSGVGWERTAKAGVKIFKEQRGVKCGSVADSFKKALAGGTI